MFLMLHVRWCARARDENESHYRPLLDAMKRVINAMKRVDTA